MCVCPSGREHMLEPGVLWKSLLPSPHPWTLLSDCTVSLSPKPPTNASGKEARNTGGSQGGLWALLWTPMGVEGCYGLKAHKMVPGQSLLANSANSSPA